MKLLILPALLLLAAAGWYGVRGEGARRGAAAAGAELRQRTELLEEQLRASRGVGRARVATWKLELDELRQRWTGWRELLLRSEAGAAPTLAAVLSSLHAPALAPGSELVGALRRAAAASPQADAALARVVGALRRSGVPRIDALELEGDGRPRPWPEVPGLLRLELRLSVVGGLDQVLACLEDLVPDPDSGAPVPWPAQATLHRVEPSRWGPDVHRMNGPPVRLTLTVGFLFAAPEPQVERP